MAARALRPHPAGVVQGCRPQRVAPPARVCSGTHRDARTVPAQPGAILGNDPEPACRHDQGQLHEIIKP